MNQQPDQANKSDKAQTIASIVMLVAQSLACPSELAMHRGFGPRYYGAQTVGASAAILVWPAFFPECNGRVMPWLFVVFLLLLIRARIESMLLQRAEWHGHSRYNGRPRWCIRMPSWDESRVKRFGEPAAVFGLGILTQLVSTPVGAFLMASAIGLFVTVHCQFLSLRKRQMDLQDAISDAEQLRNVRRVRTPRQR